MYEWMAGHMDGRMGGKTEGLKIFFQTDLLSYIPVGCRCSSLFGKKGIESATQNITSSKSEHYLRFTYLIIYFQHIFDFKHIFLVHSLVRKKMQPHPIT